MTKHSHTRREPILFLSRADQNAASLTSIPEGRGGIRATLKVMSKLVKQYKTSPRIREIALSLISDLPGKDWPAEATRLHDYVRDSIRYAQDVNGVETVQTPHATLDIGQGDCDDKSTLVAALLESIGHPTRFRAVGPESDLTHVYVETMIGDRWFASDTTEPVPFGWRAPNMRAIPMIENN